MPGLTTMSQFPLSSEVRPAWHSGGVLSPRLVQRGPCAAEASSPPRILGWGPLGPRRSSCVAICVSSSGGLSEGRISSNLVIVATADLAGAPRLRRVRGAAVEAELFYAIGEGSLRFENQVICISAPAGLRAVRVDMGRPWECRRVRTFAGGAPMAK